MLRQMLSAMLWVVRIALTDQSQRQRCAVDRDIHFLEQIRHCADMVFVSVGDDHAADLFAAALEVREIRQHHVDAVHLIVRKTHAAVDDDHLIAVLERGHVFADLVEPAERDDLEFSRCLGLCLLSVSNRFAGGRLLCRCLFHLLRRRSARLLDSALSDRLALGSCGLSSCCLLLDGGSCRAFSGGVLAALLCFLSCFICFTRLAVCCFHSLLSGVFHILRSSAGALGDRAGCVFHSSCRGTAASSLALGSRFFIHIY